MKRASILVLLPVAGLLSACASASKSTSSPASATPTTTARSVPATPGATVVTTKANKLGTILAAGPRKLTVYLFEADKATTSTCAGACAKVWPPVITSGRPQVAGNAVASRLGTARRADGALQVTYMGHPLYYFAKDGDAGDAYGQGSKLFGAGWYVLAPGGRKIDNS